ncbi:MAG: hypothetical protein JXR55_12405, partial [Candidatus Fermentibacteraceae bacterium]|nr:hypothetical protein [Candidatus Fermentibacteraceae bacterium]
MELLLNVLHKTGLSPEEALELLNARLTHHLGFAVVDGGRGIRSALPEIVLASGKSTEEILDVTDSLLSSTGLAIVSRLEPEFSGRVLERFP